MARTVDRDRARGMRQQGRSIKEIAHTLNIGTSTISYWCRNITLSETQVAHLQARQRRAAVKALLASAEKKRARRIEKENTLLKMGREEVGALNQRDLFLVGLALYWGEGYKSESGELGFTNSDAGMILFILRWLKGIFGVKDKDFILRVSINQQHTQRIKEVEHFWSKKTGISLSQFTKSSIIKTKSLKVYANANNHYGTLRVKVRRGTDLRRRILGGIEGLKSSAPK